MTSDYFQFQVAELENKLGVSYSRVHALNDIAMLP